MKEREKNKVRMAAVEEQAWCAARDRVGSLSPESVRRVSRFMFHRGKLSDVVVELTENEAYLVQTLALLAASRCFEMLFEKRRAEAVESGEGEGLCGSEGS